MFQKRAFLEQPVGLLCGTKREFAVAAPMSGLI